ncbi:hypothetical protein [Pseudoalteromonas luteoviolacea]|uniref:hypothetical protein n=1 Tax=Pseudoalteromonas luteoviolacea TaxID=43657 RepID=UPI0011516C5E|nr:hypothetical protein [Pseudoalteromonas luteoviolacea]TQF70628.1 hypothetical protein FLM44_05905 [Pseudoalteromonas luteoviolacea]
MRKIEDFLYEYEGFWKNSAGQCRIRIFIDNNDRHIGICTALPENTGTSTTNRIEHIYTDIKNRFFVEQMDAQLAKSSVISAVETFIADNKTSKAWAIAGALVLKGLKYYLKLNTGKEQDEKVERENQLIWVDHWPKGIGDKHFEHEFAVVRFSENTTPVWYHMNEANFEEYTGIDIRLLEPLELVGEND